MSARKLSRLAGLVFVLTALLGGGGAYSVGVQHGTGGYSIGVDDTASSESFGVSPATLADWQWT
jgi:hypothetical protein